MGKPVPILTAVDLVIEKSHATRGKRVLLIRRKNPPFKGMLALPGGFVDADERIADAAKRELFEETGVVPGQTLPCLFYLDDPQRDPRGRVLSFVFHALVPWGTKATAGDDAADVVWMKPADALAEGLAFDHAHSLATLGYAPPEKVSQANGPLRHRRRHRPADPQGQGRPVRTAHR